MINLWSESLSVRKPGTSPAYLNFTTDGKMPLCNLYAVTPPTTVRFSLVLCMCECMCMCMYVLISGGLHVCVGIFRMYVRAYV